MASPPFSINENLPGDADIVAAHPANARAFRDIVESYLNFEHDATTGRHKHPTDTTANLGALTFPTGSLSYDTTLDVLRYKLASGHKVVDFPQGMELFCKGPNAPPGWTKVTDAAYNNATFQLFTGAVSDGGSTAFGTVFAARAIAQANLPNVNFTVNASGTTAQHGGHTHSISSDGSHVHTAGSGATLFWASQASFTNNLDAISGDGNEELVTMDAAGAHNHGGATGSDGVHTHTVDVTGTAASGGSGTALDFAVKFIGCIAIRKD